MNWTHLLAVFAGGGIGSLLRLYMGLRFSRQSLHPVFPWGTFSANVLSSLLLGWLVAYFWAHPDWRVSSRLFFMTGLCGGFSTFSTFSAESFQMIKAEHVTLALIYLAASVLSGLVAVWAGIRLYGACCE